MTIPALTLETLQNWIENKVPTGGFLERVIDNHPVKAVLDHADPENQAALPEIVAYINRISGLPKFYDGAMREWTRETGYSLTAP